MTTKQVLLFSGRDIASQLTLSQVVQTLKKQAPLLQPVIFLPKHVRESAGKPFALRAYDFLSTHLLKDVVYPSIEYRPSVCTRYFSPVQLEEKFDAILIDTNATQDDELISAIEKTGPLIGAVNIGWPHDFNKDTIEAITAKTDFIAIHWGLLPEYRGHLSNAWRLADIMRQTADNDEYGCTLVRITNNHLNGHLLKNSVLHATPDLTLFQANINLAEPAASMIVDALDRKPNMTLRGYPQSEPHAKYFPMPDEQTLQLWDKAGLRLTSSHETAFTLVKAFSRANTVHGQKLLKEIGLALADWQAKNGPLPA